MQMPKINKLLKRHAKWLRSYMVSEGDILEIVGGFLDHRYGRTRLVIIVKDGNGVTRFLPLSQWNLRTLAKAFGTDTSHWLGKRMRVKKIRFYPALNAEGLILEPIVEKPDSESLQAEIEKTDWRPGKYGGEIAPSSRLLKLAEMLRSRGAIELNGFVYKLSRNGKWVIRSRKRA